MYQYFYTLLFVPLLSVIAFLPFFRGLKFQTIIATLLSWITVLGLLIFRDVHAPADYLSYISIYDGMSGIDSVLNAYQGDVTFAVFLHIGKLLGLDGETFFIVFSVVNTVILFLGFKYLFPTQKYVIFSFLLFVLTSTFVLMFTNAIRQGLSIALFILAIGLHSRSHKLTSYLIIVSAIFSHSSIIPFACFFALRSYFVERKINYRVILLAIPFCFFIGYSLLDILSLYFNKFQMMIIYDDLAYGKTQIYLKALILYLFGVLFYVYGNKYENFGIYGYKSVFDIYLFGLIIVFSALPVLFIASRFVYHVSALVPLLLTYVFFSKRNAFNVEVRAVVYFIGMLMYGFSVYNFPSIQSQLTESY